MHQYEEWIDSAQDRDYQRSVVNMSLNPQVIRHKVNSFNILMQFTYVSLFSSFPVPSVFYSFIHFSGLYIISWHLTYVYTHTHTVSAAVVTASHTKQSWVQSRQDGLLPTQNHEEFGQLPICNPALESQQQLRDSTC